MIQVVLLGPIGVHASERGVVQPQGDPAKRLLAWLALPPHPDQFHEREAIAEQLWPGRDRKRTQDNLSQALGRVVAVLKDLGLESHLKVEGPRRSRLGLFQVDSDLARFRAHRDRDDLAGALAQVEGPPLAGIGLGAGSWDETTRDAIRDELDAVCESHADRLEQFQNFAAALEIHERRLVQDPYNQAALRGIMRCHEAEGRPKIALARLSQHQGALPRVGLDAETLELKQSLEGWVPTQLHLPRSPRRYAPTNTYKGTPKFDPAFNHGLMRDLACSRSYIFRGISAKYVPGRVKLRGPGLDVVRVMLLDLNADEAIRLRALDRSHNPKYAGKNPDELQAELRHEIVVSLVSLFEVRNICTVDVACIATTAVDRVELFDDALYVSLYHGPRSDGFPETLRYSSDSVAYGQHRLDCARVFDLTERRFQFRAEHAISDLPELFHTAGIAVDGSLIDSYCEEANSFTTNFVGWLTDH